MIETSLADQVATITVDDFSALTMHDEQLVTSLRDAVVDASDDDDTKVIVLRSGGPDFCAPSGSAPVSTQAEIWTTWNQLFATSSALYQSLCFSKKITITEVSGRCAGAGSMLVLCSDLTVADTTARFFSPFDALPESNFVLASLTMRLNRAKSWMLRDSVLSATQADACGLVNSVVEPSELALAVASLARSATVMPLDGVTMSKMMLQAVLDAHGVGREFDMAGFYAVAHHERGGTFVGRTS